MQDIVARRERLLGKAYKLFYAEPIEFVSGSGVHLYDRDGNEFLDAYNNVASIGHCHPHVVEAVSKQIATLNTHTRYASETILDYSERLLGTMPEGVDRVMFTCTGSESNDLALRMARLITGHQGVIITENAYHGTTASLTGVSASMGPGVPLGVDVRTVPAPFPRPGVDVAAKFDADVASAIEDMERHGIKVAALIVDAIFSSDGVLPDPAGFLAPAVERVRRAGGLFISDEVQPGFARTGDAMWGVMRHGISPDLLTTGKPMGNGFPVAALAGRSGIIDEFGSRQRYFNTFGGNNVAIAAASAVLDVIEDEGLMDNSRRVGQYLKDQLSELSTHHSRLGEVRGAGLFVGVDIVGRDSKVPDSQACLDLVNGMRKRRVLISATGRAAATLKIRPQLPFKPENVDQLVSVLDETLNEID
jgi:4-aminobutyrate aminotransferase-like enzyme